MPSQQADCSPFWNVLSAAHCPVMCLASLKAHSEACFCRVKGSGLQGWGQNVFVLSVTERGLGVCPQLSPSPCVNVRKGGVPFRC